MEPDAPLIFFNYANPDQIRVLPFFDLIEHAGFNAWIDCRRIKAGQNWDFEIKRALDKAALVIAFISNNSVNRRGYVQRELKTALDKQAEKLETDIYIIPILLDEYVVIPASLKDRHYVRANDPGCKDQLLVAVRHQLDALGIEAKKVQEKEEMTWTTNTIREAWDGTPGYEFELGLIEFQSTKYRNVTEINAYLKGYLLRDLFRYRSTKLLPQSDSFNFGQDKFWRTHTYDGHCGEPSIVGNILSISYSIHSYGAGAAHGNQHFETFAFVLEPLTLIETLQSIFLATSSAFTTIQSTVRSELCRELYSGTEETVGQLEKEWIERGTRDWDSFRCFKFEKKGILVMFVPYQVASYAQGPHIAEVPYEKIVADIRPEFRSALQIEYLLPLLSGSLSLDFLKVTTA